MKLIVAIIQPDRFEEVHQALTNNEIYRITVGRVMLNLDEFVTRG